MALDITLGQYYPGESPLHRMDPRAKLLLTLMLIVGVFLADSYPAYLVFFAYVLAAARLSKIPLKLMLKGLKAVYFIVVLTFVLNALFGSGQTALIRWQFLTITREGLRTAVFMALRLMLLVFGTQLLTLTTSPIALTDGLERLFAPFSRIGFPAHEMAMMMSIALRFIPTLLEEADKIMKAQTARGADFETGNLMARAKAMIPLLVPLFVSAFRRADELALAMEARCYRGGANRTRMRVLKYSPLDAWAAFSMAALIALVVLL